MNGSCWYCRKPSEWRFIVTGTGCHWVQEYCHRHAVLVQANTSPACSVDLCYLGETSDLPSADLVAVAA
jgi:hypothetical protein